MLALGCGWVNLLLLLLFRKKGLSYLLRVCQYKVHSTKSPVGGSSKKNSLNSQNKLTRAQALDGGGVLGGFQIL